MSCTGSQSWSGLYTRSCSWLLSPKRAYLRNICASSCLNRQLPAPLVRCALLIAVIFLYLGPALLYPRIGHLLRWVLHYGLWNDSPPELRSVMLHGISSASLRSLKTYFHQPVTLRAPLNSLL